MIADAKRPVRILFVVNNPDFFLSHRLAIAQAALASGFEVHVATPEKGNVAAVLGHGFLFHAIPMDRSKGRPWIELRTLWSLYRLYRRLAPALVHHVTIKPVLYGSMAARLAAVPCVVNAIPGLGYVFISRGLKSGFIRVAVKACYRFAFRHPNQKIIFQNEDDIQSFLEAKLVPRQDAVLIRGSGADPKVFHPLPEPAGDPLILLASRMLWDKGIREFVEAAALLKGRGLRARFVLVGDVDQGNPASIPQDWLRDTHANGDVEWWGPRTDMPDILNQAHVVCLPSYREGLPKVLIEAAACGKPLVATDAPGCREIVRNGENGLLVRVRDGHSLAEAVLRLVEEPGLRQRLGRNGREMVEREFTLDGVVNRTLALYRELLDKRQSINGQQPSLANGRSGNE